MKEPWPEWRSEEGQREHGLKAGFCPVGHCYRGKKETEAAGIARNPACNVSQEAALPTDAAADSHGDIYFCLLTGTLLTSQQDTCLPQTMLFLKSICLSEPNSRLRFRGGGALDKLQLPRCKQGLRSKFGCRPPSRTTVGHFRGQREGQ